MNQDSTIVSEDAEARRPLAWRWRWYHFYFLLALFDLVIIVASLGLYHRSLGSFQVALDNLSWLEIKEKWITDLRLTLLELNAPGNDVFETRDVKMERARFEETRKRLMKQLGREGELEADLNRFRRQLEAMMAQEQIIFDTFETLEEQTLSPSEHQIHLNEVSAAMASMDRSQARAVRSLSDIEKVWHIEEGDLLQAYHNELASSAALERVLLGAVAFILIGVFWYGRKLQRTHEQMIMDRQLIMEERHARLAAVGEVCSTVAHGIRNPLAAITSSAQLALEFGTLDETTKLRLRDVLMESRRLNQRVTHLLDFSKVPDRVFERFDLRDVVEQAVNELSVRLEESSIRVRTTLDTRPIVIHGDRERLVQSVIELLSNSMDHLPAGGRIHVSCKKNPYRMGQAVLSVEDDGPGIPDGIRLRVFDLFVTSKADGHGIGLASVKRSVELHGGTVEVLAGQERGAHIRIELPLA